MVGERPLNGFRNPANQPATAIPDSATAPRKTPHLRRHFLCYISPYPVRIPNPVNGLTI